MHAKLRSIEREVVRKLECTANTATRSRETFLHAYWLRYLFPVLVGGGEFGAGILLGLGTRHREPPDGIRR